MEELRPIYKVTIIYPNGNIEKDSFLLEPIEGQTFNGKEEMYYIKKSVFTCVVSDETKSIKYYTIYAEPYNKEMIGVTQTKFISCNFGGNDVVEILEEQLNEFLYETRHTHHIIDITHTMAYIAVKYKLRNSFDVEKHKAAEESYQKNGAKIKFISQIINGKEYHCDINVSNIEEL
jgi:1-acyl-sn-glycerol-3-phosphate acyltransferase